MSARLLGHLCFHCGMSVWVGRYAPGGSSLCFDCLEEEKARTEAEVPEPLGDAEEVREEKQ